tara:strand:+ start:1045 stop:1839 length:795 start_codon:yes stop_codon:yes gene_type:complete
MKNKILIIGKKSFIGSNLKNYLSKHFFVKIESYENLKKKNKNFLSKFTHVINTSIHKNYIKKNYNQKYDLDRQIIKHTNKINFIYFFLNSRKIYKPNLNILETSKLLPQNNYAKNKIITENYLKKKIKKKFISLRISNVIGNRIYKKHRNSHNLFLDNFIKLKKNYKNNVTNNDYKDFITINYLCKVIKLLIKKNVIGIFNVSLSEKVYISEITKWLNYSIFKKLTFSSTTSDSFTLSNKKLLRCINIKMSKKQLEKFCKKLNI